jgi:fermentation-respiration switch protein FrsA (DUF1100 family)
VTRELADSISNNPKRSWGYALFRIGRFCVFAYLAILVYLMLAETKLVYPGSKYPNGNWQPTEFVFEEVEFQASDGTPLAGWYLPKTDSAETVLLCHGNAENAAQASAYMGRALGNALKASVFVYDYRGFGRSGGKPDEQGVLDDSKAALRWLNQKTGTTPNDVIIVGHSIGGGPACYLAAECGAKVLVLQRTFNSLVDAAQCQYPWVPVGLLMRNRFPSEDRIRNYRGPLFQSHGSEDTVVPCRLGRKLFDCCPSANKRFFELQGSGHFDPFPPAYWQELVEFVKEASEQSGG